MLAFGLCSVYGTLVNKEIDMPYQNQTDPDAPMTAAQAAFLRDLCKQTDDKFYENLTKTQASKRIDELQRKRRTTKTTTATGAVR